MAFEIAFIIVLSVLALIVVIALSYSHSKLKSGAEDKEPKRFIPHS